MLSIENQTVGLREFYANQATHAYNELDFQLAERLFKQALAQSERTGISGKDLAADISNVARACHQQAKFSEAEQYYRRAISLLESAVGGRHPDLADVLHDLARIKCTFGEFVEGRQFLERAIVIRTELFGPADPQVITTKEELDSIPATGAEEAPVAKHLSVAKEIPVPEESFDIDKIPAPAPVEVVPEQPPSLEADSIFDRLPLPVEEPVSHQEASVDEVPVQLPPPKPRSVEGDTLVDCEVPFQEELAVVRDVPVANNVLAFRPPAIVQEAVAPVKVANANQSFDHQAFIHQDFSVLEELTAAAVPGLVEQTLALTAHEEQTLPPFHDIGSFELGRPSPRPIDLRQFAQKDCSSRELSSRRRLPRSFVGEAENYYGEPQVSNYEIPRGLSAAGGGLLFNFSMKEAGSPIWQYVCAGVVVMIIAVSLLAVFAKGS